MPDQFGGDPAPNSTNRVTSPTAAGFEQTSSPSILDRIKLGVADTAKSFMIDMWLARQTPEKVLPRVLKVVEAAKDEYADAVAHGGGIYGVGYCFGARYVLILAGADPAAHPSLAPATLPNPLSVVTGAATTTATTDEESQPAVPAPSGPLLKVAAVAHATLVTREDVRAVQVPLCVVAVQDDPLFPEEVLEVGRQAWAAAGVDCQIEVFQGVPHGFAVLGEYADKSIKAEQERAWTVMGGWLDGH